MASPPLYIVGAGALGLHLAARLSAVTPVTIVARGPRGAEQGHFQLPVVDLAQPLPASAELLLAVKATQLRETLHHLRPGPQHALGLCQTGLGIAAMARALAPNAARVRLGCWLAVGLASPTVVRVGGVYQVELAADEPEALRTRDRWQRLLGAAGYPVRTVSSVAACEWRKALVNLAVSGLCASLGERTGAVVDSAPLNALAREIFAGVRTFSEIHGKPPKVILLANHGVICPASSCEGAWAALAMTAKAASIFTTAELLGGAIPLTDASVARLDARPDEAYRRAVLGL